MIADFFDIGLGDLRDVNHAGFPAGQFHKGPKFGDTGYLALDNATNLKLH
jgi:hypothetical protein